MADVITEPATLVTDYLLALFTAVLAWRLRAASRVDGSPQRWWARGFAATAVAGTAGGTVHGFRLVLPPAVTSALWTLTLEALVVAALAVVLAMLAASALGERRRGVLGVVACLAYGGYALWLPRRPEFALAMVAYGSALALLAAVETRAWLVCRSPASRWLLAGVAASVLAAALQRSGWSPHRHFNHNDLFHVIQAGALWLLYRGALESQQLPARARPSRAP